jgi:hypothetical protein
MHLSTYYITEEWLTSQDRNDQGGERFRLEKIKKRDNKRRSWSFNIKNEPF